MPPLAFEKLRKLSVIIVTWKGDDLVRGCLDSLRQSCGDALEIVVVDNAAEETCRALVEKYPGVKYVPSPGNPGFAGGNNIGLKYCTREFVLLLNNDTLVREEPFTQLITYLEEHPRVGIVQGTLILPRVEEILDDCGTLLTPWGIQFHRYIGQKAATTKRPTAPVFSGKGALLLFRRNVIEDLGGVLFYDHFKSYYEETDFCHRAWLMGWETHFVDTPSVIHLCGATSTKFKGADIWAQYLANILFSFRTNLSRYGKMRILPRFLLLNVANLAKNILTGNFGMVGAYVRAWKLNRKRCAAYQAARKRVQETRRLSDRELFKRILFKPSWRYFWCVARGRAYEK